MVNVWVEGLVLSHLVLFAWACVVWVWANVDQEASVGGAEAMAGRAIVARRRNVKVGQFC